MVNQLAGKTHLAGDVGQMVFVKEVPGAEFGILQLDGSAFIFSRETHHQSEGVGPRLARKIADVADTQARFLHDFPFHALFQRLSGFHKTCHQSVVVPLEVASMHHECFVTPGYQDNDGGRHRRPYLLTTARAAFADVGMPVHWHAA